jgi:hypothetical protein
MACSAQEDEADEIRGTHEENKKCEKNFRQKFEGRWPLGRPIGIRNGNMKAYRKLILSRI